jgi:hypothetical protein
MNSTKIGSRLRLQKKDARPVDWRANAERSCSLEANFQFGLPLGRRKASSTADESSAAEIAAMLGVYRRRPRYWVCWCPLCGLRSLSIEDRADDLIIVNCTSGGCPAWEIFRELRRLGFVSVRQAKQSLAEINQNSTTTRNSEFKTRRGRFGPPARRANSPTGGRDPRAAPLPKTGGV